MLNAMRVQKGWCRGRSGGKQWPRGWDGPGAERRRQEGRRLSKIGWLMTAWTGFALVACSSPPTSNDSEHVGAVLAALELAPGQSIASATYALNGPGGFARGGTLALENSTTLTAVIGGLPAGAGYEITLTASTSEGALSCTGSAAFEIRPRMTTSVRVHVRCQERARTGSVAVNGTVNVCPLVDALSATPAEVAVGGSIALASEGHDLDDLPSPLAYHWSAVGGTLSGATGENVTFTCTTEGPAEISVTASDGDCSDTASITVLCSPRPAIPVAIRINEVESSGGTPGDWVELYNVGTAPVDVGGWVVKDNDDTHVYVIAPGTTIAALGFLIIEEASLGFGLGAADSARLYQPDGTTLVDSYAWTAHATTTYGRCPDGSGAFTATGAPTRGGPNNCGGGTGGAAGGTGGTGGAGGTMAFAWPGGPEVSAAAEMSQFPQNLSGLTYEPAAGAQGPVLWAVLNSPPTLLRLVPAGTTWASSLADGWGAGKTLRFPSGGGNPDAESVTKAERDAPFVYVSIERDDGGPSRLSVLRYDTSLPGTTLVATHEWDLSADLLPPVGPNQGLEAITWVPDALLVAQGFVDERLGTPYDPAAYPGHGSGLFLVGVEGKESIYAYALDHGAAASFTRIATFASGHPNVMAIELDRDTGYLWTICDDACGNKTAVLHIGATVPGRFGVRRVFDRPAQLSQSSHEGFAVTPESECIGGLKPVFWSDDANLGGRALHRGTIPCGPFLL